MYFNNIFRVSATVALLFTGVVSRAQERQFIQEESIKIPGILADSQIYNLNVSQKQTVRTYLDGLGRPIQTVAVKASPQQHDIVQITTYDNLGRKSKGYLPYTETDGTGNLRSNALANQAAFYSNGAADKIADDSSPFSQQVFENSPLQRVLQAGSVGDGYQPGQHYKTMTYRNNTAADNVIMWSPDGTNKGYYAANALLAAQITDEQGVSAITFKDVSGQLILKRRLTSQTINGVSETGLDTYYIYNDAGAISYIIPPKAVAAMRASSSWDLTQAAVNKLLFKYVYDDRGRVIEKTLPSQLQISIIYDPLSRPVLMQDPNLRAQNKWNYVKYDIRGRAISQGIYTDNTRTTRAAMQAYVSGLNYTVSYFEQRNTESANGYYSNNIFPTAGIEPLAYSYYDDYDLDGNGSADYSYQVQGLTGEATATSLTRGLATMLRKRTIGVGVANAWLTSVIFYDKKGNVIQTLSNNQLTAAVSSSATSVPDFVGKVQISKVVKVAGSTTTTVQSSYTYDHAGRLLALDQAYNAAQPVRIASYAYNELGQMVQKGLQMANSGNAPPANVTLGVADALSSTDQKTVRASQSITMTAGFSAAAGSTLSAAITTDTYLQRLDYRYNIRGQLLSINNSTLSNDGVSNSDNTDVFGLELFYDQADATLGNTPYYNGMVSAVKWMAKTTTLTQRSYRFEYDDQSRLQNAYYADRKTGTATWGNSGGFDEKSIAYDHNGNITALKRNALANNAVTEIDNLQYTYEGNQLANVADGTSASYAALGFKNLTGAATAYEYDSNGNQTRDYKKGTTTSYNLINRTDRVTITTAVGRYINYTYDATGNLLRKQQYDNNTLQKTTDYIDGFVYENNTLAYFSMPEGRIRNSGGTLKAEYMLTDQQGNVRVSIEDNGSGQPVVRQENSYYPFGLVMSGSQVATPTSPNKNLYNGGSEWQNDYGDLPDLMQTFYRSYDAALGRWTGIDPLAEQTDDLSPYHYSGNNPVMYNDPLGDKITQPMYPYHEPYLSDSDWARLSEGRNGGHNFTGMNGTPAGSTWSLAYYSVASADFLRDEPGMGERTAKDYSDSELLAAARNGDLEALREYGRRFATVGYYRVYEAKAYGILNSATGENMTQGVDSHLVEVTNQGRRPDADGFLTKEEAINWYRHGHGGTLSIRLDQLDLSKVYVSDFLGGVGSKYAVNLSFKASIYDNIVENKAYHQGWVLGNITLKLYPNNEVRAFDDFYNFEYHNGWNPFNWPRNIDTAYGRLVNGDGTPYIIKITGSANIQSNSPSHK